MLWGFIRRYAPGRAAETHPRLDAAAGYAVRYFEDFVRPAKRYRRPDAARGGGAGRPARPAGGLGRAGGRGGAAGLVYAVGKEHGFEPLRAWFAAIYEVLLGGRRGRASAASRAVEGGAAPAAAA